MFSNGLFIFVSLFITSGISWSQTGGPQTAQQAANEQTSNHSHDATVVAEAEVSDIFLLCKREKGVRWLRAYKLDNGKCKTLYSKEGYLQVVSSATYFSSCEGVLQSVRQNLEEGGFKCIAVPKVSFLGLEN